MSDFGNTCSLVGDVRTTNPSNPEYFETILRELEEFMIHHSIDKIDVSWSRKAIIRDERSGSRRD